MEVVPGLRTVPFLRYCEILVPSIFLNYRDKLLLPSFPHIIARDYIASLLVSKACDNFVI